MILVVLQFGGVKIVMKYTCKLISLVALLFAMPVAITHAENEHPHEPGISAPGVESLSPELRNLLLKEMRELQKGLMSIIPAYTSGNWREIEDIGLQMEHSYILKQNITKEQINEFHSSLPGQFIELDQRFHYFAGMLSHAAKIRKQELVGFYLSKLSETCVACHSKYATHRFKGFAEPMEASGHPH